MCAVSVHSTSEEQEGSTLNCVSESRQQAADSRHGCAPRPPTGETVCEREGKQIRHKKLIALEQTRASRSSQSHGQSPRGRERRGARASTLSVMFIAAARERGGAGRGTWRSDRGSHKAFIQVQRQRGGGVRRAQRYG